MCRRRRRGGGEEGIQSKLCLLLARFAPSVHLIHSYERGGRWLRLIESIKPYNSYVGVSGDVRSAVLHEEEEEGGVSEGVGVSRMVSVRPNCIGGTLEALWHRESDAHGQRRKGPEGEQESDTDTARQRQRQRQRQKHT